MTALLDAKAFVGFDEVLRFITEQNNYVVSSKKEVVADLVNAACEKIELEMLNPVIAQNYVEYYYGNGKDRLDLKYSPVIIDVDHTFTLKVRPNSSNTLVPDSNWETWVRDTDYIVDLTRGTVILNPAEKTTFPTGFRNVQVSYGAGWGVQTAGATPDSEITGSTVPSGLRLAAKKLVECWYRESVMMMSQTMAEATEFNRQKAMESALPSDVAKMLEPYKKKRGLRWLLF